MYANNHNQDRRDKLASRYAMNSRSKSFLSIVSLFAMTAILPLAAAANGVVVTIAPVKHGAKTLVEASKEGPEKKPSAAPSRRIPGMQAIKTKAAGSGNKEASTPAVQGSGQRNPFKRLSASIRSIEAQVIQENFAYELGEIKKSAIDTVVMAPSSVSKGSYLHAASDGGVELTVTKADMKQFELKARMETARGRKIEKVFKQTIEEDQFTDKDGYPTEVYQSTLRRAAMWVSNELSKEKPGSFAHLSNIVYASKLAPEMYPLKTYMKGRNMGKAAVKRQPAADDAYYNEAVEARLATIEIYQKFDREVVAESRMKSYGAYASWRLEAFAVAEKYYELRKQIGAIKAKQATFVAIKILGPIVAQELLEDLGVLSEESNVDDYVAYALTLWQLVQTFKITEDGIDFNRKALENADPTLQPIAKALLKTIERSAELQADIAEQTEALTKLNSALSDSIEPVNIQYRGRSYTLEGQVEEKLARLQEIIEADYKEKTGSLASANSPSSKASRS